HVLRKSHPTETQLAAELGYTRNPFVHTVLPRLARKRRIRIIHHCTPTGRWLTNTYEIADASGVLSGPPFIGPAPPKHDGKLRTKLVNMINERSPNGEWVELGSYSQLAKRMRRNPKAIMCALRSAEDKNE